MSLQVQLCSGVPIHLGMVSALRMTRDVLAARGGGDGNRKFLDEFHTWREVSYAHCYHHPNTHRTVEGLPQWARATLEAHAGDARGPVMPLERLAAAKTGYDLWDAMQQCLIQRGELHNNARMTWGQGGCVVCSPHLTCLFSRWT